MRPGVRTRDARRLPRAGAVRRPRSGAPARRGGARHRRPRRSRQVGARGGGRAGAGAVGRTSRAWRTSACGWPACAGCRRSARSASCSARSPTCAARCELLCRYEHSYNEALRLRLDEAGDLATMRLWFEFGEPAPTRQALELATAALLGHRPRAARPAVGAAVGLLHPPGPGVARRPPGGVRAPAAVRARVHRAGLLRRRARRRRTRRRTPCCGPTPSSCARRSALRRPRR